MDPDSCMTEFVQFIELDENPFILKKTRFLPLINIIKLRVLYQTNRLRYSEKFSTESLGDSLCYFHNKTFGLLFCFA